METYTEQQVREAVKKPSKQRLKYLKFQEEYNPEGLTWRQFYERHQGPNPHWMNTTQYGGEWLDKKMEEV